MLILVDGYNVTMKDPATRDRDKEAQRDALVHRLATRGSALLGKGSIVVVFDSRDRFGLSSETCGTVKVVYATDADSEIVRRCDAAGEHVVVVTDDMRQRARISQDVSRRVEYRGASTCFDAAGRGPQRKDRRPRITRETGLPADADEITKDLMDTWGVED